MSRVMNTPCANQIVVSKVGKPCAGHVVGGVKSEASLKKRPSASVVKQKPSCSTSSSMSYGLSEANRQSWLDDVVIDINVVPSLFATAVSQRLQFRGILPSEITAYRVQSLLNEAEDDYAHAHHMLDIGNGHAHHILQYMSQNFQSSFGSVCDWMMELRFIYISC